MAEDLNTMLTRKTNLLGLEVWEIVVLSVSLFIVLILCVLALCIISRSKARRVSGRHALAQIPDVSGEIKEIHVVGNGFGSGNGSAFIIHDNPYVEESDSSRQIEMDGYSGAFNSSHSNKVNCPSPSMDLPEFSQLGWGHWFTLRDLELATNGFLKENIIGEGGYGVVHHGKLSNGTPVAVKKLFNNKGQAETEFRVEVEAIGNVRHKNLVRLLGYCVEGTHRLLVYEYVKNGNLEQWLHGTVDKGNFSWDSRINVLLGTAKALAYLHEAIEPKVIHRDIKSSNILIDDGFNAKVSDFGLAKLMGAGKSHITTRVMGTFGYVAPEYANSGLLNEKSDVYSFGVVFLEAITGMDPVDYNRPKDKVNLVEWLKMMVAGRRSEEVVDPKIKQKPSTRELKRALLTALRCVDPDYEKRPRMSQVVRMMEPDEYPMPSEGKRQRNQGNIRGEEEQCNIKIE